MSTMQTMTMTQPPSTKTAATMRTDPGALTIRLPEGMTEADLKRFVAQHWPVLSGSLTSTSPLAKGKGQSPPRKLICGRKAPKTFEDLDTARAEARVPFAKGSDGSITIDTGRHELTYRPELAKQLFDYSEADRLDGRGRGWCLSDPTSGTGKGLLHNARVQSSWAAHEAKIKELEASLGPDESLKLLEVVRHEQGVHNVGMPFTEDPHLTSVGIQHAKDMWAYRQDQHKKGMKSTDFVACSDLSRCAHTITTQLGMDTSTSDLASLRPHEKFTIVPNLAEFHRGRQALPTDQKSFMTTFKNCDALTSMESKRTYDPKRYLESDRDFNRRVAQGISDVLDVAPSDASHITFATHHGWAEAASQLFGQDVNLANGAAMVLPIIVKKKRNVDESTRATTHVPAHIQALRKEGSSSTATATASSTSNTVTSTGSQLSTTGRSSCANDSARALRAAWLDSLSSGRTLASTA